MKKVITLLVFLFTSVYCNGQDFLSVPDGLTKSNGTGFPIFFNMSNPPAGCVKQEIEINIGKRLVYLESSINHNLGGGTITEDINEDGDTILTISDINSNGTAGGSRKLCIYVQFPEGTTCNDATSIIKADLYACGTIQVSGDPITVTAHTDNVAKATISQMTLYDNDADNNGSAEAFCLGKIVRYNVKVTNNGPSGFNIQNPKILLEIPKCSVLVGFYLDGTYTSVSPDPVITTETTLQKVAWQMGEDLYLQTVYNREYNYDVYVQYPCNGAEACSIGLNNISVKLDGEILCEDPILPLPIPEPNLTTTIQTNINTGCTTTCSGGGVSLFNHEERFPCPTAVRHQKYIRFNYNTPPESPVLPDLVFTVDIPNDGLIVKSADVFWSASSACDGVTTEYLDSNNTSISFPNPAIKKVRWTIPCTTNVPTISFIINFDYTSTSIPTDYQLPFGYTLTSSDSSRNLSGNLSLDVEDCKPDVISYKRVRKKGLTYKLPFGSTTESGLPNDVFTYRLVIENIGTDIDNLGTLISDQLDSHLEYAGGFKYAYTNINNNTEPLFTSLGVANSFEIITDGITQNVSVSLPTDSSNEIKLSGFKFPYTDKRLYIEFNVKVKRDVIAGSLIPNSLMINGTSASTPTYIQILRREIVTSEMLVRCPMTDEWIKNSVDVKHGNKIDFKMKFVNAGTVPVTLSKLINLKPQSGDLYEIGSASRNSAFSINYVCGTNSISTSAGTVLPAVTYAYANNDVTMRRDMLCPPTTNGLEPAWGVETTCSNSNSNWFKVEFPNGLYLTPGEYVEVIYKGEVDGTIGTVENPLKAINSFAYVIQECSLTSDDAEITINNNGLTCSATPIPCMECTSFDLLKGQKYLVSGWVKEMDPATPDEQLKNFSNGVISVSFLDVEGDTIGAPNVFHTSGEIIDGWQRIIGEFTVPIEVDDMFLELQNTGTKMTYFDDIRVLPTKGNMKSFVYDQKTQRLMSELDENNYGTFYEYDLEGGLVRIKKETEKGVFTIQETRSGNTKSAQ